MNDLNQFDELCCVLSSLAPDVEVLHCNIATTALNSIDEVRLRHQWYRTAERLMRNADDASVRLAGLRLHLLTLPGINNETIDALRTRLDLMTLWEHSIRITGSKVHIECGCSIDRHREDEPTAKSLEEFGFGETAHAATEFVKGLRVSTQPPTRIGMNVDDLIAGFTELEKLDPWARFVWNTVGDNHIIRVVSTGSQTGAEFHALLEDAGAFVPDSNDNPGENNEQRFIVHVFTIAPELVASEAGPVHRLPYAYEGNEGEEMRRVPASSETIQHAAKAAVIALRRMRSAIIYLDGCKSHQPERQHDLPMLSPKASAVYELLLSLPEHRGMTGPDIADAISKDVNFDESTFRKSIVPALKAYGLEHTPKVGYRITPSRRPKRDSA